jgi:hypothetical protein
VSGVHGLTLRIWQPGSSEFVVGVRFRHGSAVLRGQGHCRPIRGKDSTITFARAHTSFCILRCAFGRLVARIDRFRPCRRRTLALRRRSQPAGGRKAPVRWISDARVRLKPRIPLRQFKSEPSDFNRAARGRLDRGHS